MWMGFGLRPIYRHYRLLDLTGSYPLATVNVSNKNKKNIIFFFIGNISFFNFKKSVSVYCVDTLSQWKNVSVKMVFADIFQQFKCR